MGNHSCGSQWWIPSSWCPGPRLNCDSALLHLGTATWSSIQWRVAALTLPTPPLCAPCLWILFSFASNSTQLLPQVSIWLPWTLLFNTLGKNEPSCWSLGPWANKQKRKMVHAGGGEVKGKPGSQMIEKSVLNSGFEEILPFSPLNLHYSSASKNTTPTHT